jgi:predicted transposase YbfD/YdcC
MESYAKSKEKFLHIFLDLPNGIPSHDTFNRVFSNIDSNEFEAFFIEWVSELAQLQPREIIAIDAMGCQTAIAKAIIKKEADYILAVKDNQPQLLEHIEDEFRFGKNIETHLSQNLDHGRIEARKCSVISNFEFIENNNKWQNLTSIIKIESTREFKNSDKPVQHATRYYI